jgi:hypothetical protein
LYFQPGLAGLRWPWGAFLALAALYLLLATPSQAQDDDREGSDTPARAEVPPNDGSVLGRLGLRPLYTSTVDVNRKSFLWGQSLKMDRTIQRLKLQNSWDIGISKNSDINHYKSRTGKSAARAEYGITGLGGWSTGADLGLKRNFTGGDYNRTVDNGSEFSWFATAGAPGLLLSRVLGLAEGALSWDVTGSAGATENMDIRENWAQGGGGGRADSTYATGSTEGIDSRFSMALGQKWKLDVTGKTDRASDHSRTRQRNTLVNGIADTTLVAENASSGKQVAFTTTWSPTPKDRVGLSGQYNRSVNQDYSAEVRAQDTKTGLDQRIAVDVKLVPFWGINLNLKADNGRTDIKYALSPQGRGNTETTADGSLNFIVGSAVPLLRGTEMTSEASWQKNRNTFQSSTTGYRNDITTLRQVLRRPLGSRVAAVATGEASMNRMMYDDKKQDKDDLRFLLDGALKYRPRKGLDCSLTSQWRSQQTVYIPAANSRNSVTAKSYAMGADVGLQVTPLVKVTQGYKMTADYSFYDFNESSNVLSRTTEVRTRLESTLGRKAKLSVDHSFRFKDSGRYVRDTPGAPRLYAKASGETIQALGVTTRYEFSPEFALRATQKMEVRELRHRGNPDPPPVRTKILGFTAGLDLNHRFSKDFSVNARVEKTQSSAEKGYWRVSGSLSQVF